MRTPYGSLVRRRFGLRMIRTLFALSASWLFPSRLRASLPRTYDWLFSLMSANCLDLGGGKFLMFNVQPTVTVLGAKHTPLNDKSNCPSHCSRNTARGDNDWSFSPISPCPLFCHASRKLHCKPTVVPNCSHKQYHLALFGRSFLWGAIVLFPVIIFAPCYYLCSLLSSLLTVIIATCIPAHSVIEEVVSLTF